MTILWYFFPKLNDMIQNWCIVLTTLSFSLPVVPSADSFRQQRLYLHEWPARHFQMAIAVRCAHPLLCILPRSGSIMMSSVTKYSASEILHFQKSNLDPMIIRSWIFHRTLKFEYKIYTSSFKRYRCDNKVIIAREDAGCKYRLQLLFIASGTPRFIGYTVGVTGLFFAPTLMLARSTTAPGFK